MSSPDNFEVTDPEAVLALLRAPDGSEKIWKYELNSFENVLVCELISLTLERLTWYWYRQFVPLQFLKEVLWACG